MKKFLVTQSVWFLFLAAFVAAIAYPEQPGFLSVATVLLWTLVVMLILAVCASTATMVKAKKGDDKAILDIRKYVEDNPKHGLVRKTLGWIQSVIIMVLAAYSGLVVAAPLFLVFSLLASGVNTAYRDTLIEIDAAKAARDADV